MGVIRWLLAIAVSSAHTGQSIFGTTPLEGFGAVSVFSFFVISGFYMALVINEKYALRPNWITTFYVNRWLRLYPAYVVVLILSIMAAKVSGRAALLPTDQFLSHLGSANGLATVWVFVANATMFFSDLGFITFLSPSSGWTVKPVADSIEAGRLLLIPQAWSLATELCFYLLAPFIVRQRWLVLAGMIGLNLIIRAKAPELQAQLEVPGYVYGWAYTLTPTAFIYFLWGVVAYRLYKLYARWNLSARIGWVLLPVVIAVLVSYNEIRIGANQVEKMQYFVALVFICTPFIFIATKRSRIDRWVGELSYAIFVSHFLVAAMLSWPEWASLAMWNPVSARIWQAQVSWIYWIALMLVALAIVVLIEQPIDRWRQAYAEGRRPGWWKWHSPSLAPRPEPSAAPVVVPEGTYADLLWAETVAALPTVQKQAEPREPVGQSG